MVLRRGGGEVFEAGERLQLVQLEAQAIEVVLQDSLGGDALRVEALERCGVIVVEFPFNAEAEQDQQRERERGGKKRKAQP